MAPALIGDRRRRPRTAAERLYEELFFINLFNIMHLPVYRVR